MMPYACGETSSTLKPTRASCVWTSSSNASRITTLLNYGSGRRRVCTLVELRHWFHHFGVSVCFLTSLNSPVMSRLVAATYVLLFLLRLRFPKHVSFSNIIRKRYNNATLSLYRKTEKLDFKTQKTRLDLDFLLKCKAYNVIPKFLNFKLYSSRVTRTLPYKSF